MDQIVEVVKENIAAGLSDREICEMVAAFVNEVVSSICRNTEIDPCNLRGTISWELLKEMVAMGHTSCATRLSVDLAQQSLGVDINKIN